MAIASPAGERTGRPLRLLMVEDSPAAADYVRLVLERAGVRFEARLVDREADFVAALAQERPDAVLADYGLPDWTGLDALRLLRERHPDVPFLVVTASESEEVAVRFLRAGTDDYLLKHDLARLPLALDHAVERRRLEARTRRAERAYRHVAAVSGSLVAVLELDGLVLDASPSYRAALGHEPAELEGRSLVLAIHPEDRAAVAARIGREGPQEGPPLIYRQRHRNGTWKILEGRVDLVRDDAGHPVSAVLVSRDLTEKRRVESAIEASAREWRATFDALGVSVALTDLDGTILRANRSMCDLTGLRWDALIGAPVDEVLACRQPPWEACPRRAMLVSRRRQVARLECGDRWLEVAVDPLPDRAGALVGAIYVITDVSRQRRDELALQESHEKLRQALAAITQAIALTIERRDPYTAGHQHRVAEMSRAIGERMGLDAFRIEGLRTAAEVHDLGKISVPAEILAKPGRLTTAEFAIIQAHVEAGFEILRPIAFPWPVADMVAQHHERMDGTGYPAGLSGDRILPEARILAVADVVEAMASHRPYRPALGLDAAAREILAGRGTRYDPAVADACLALVAEQALPLA